MSFIALGSSSVFLEIIAIRGAPKNDMKYTVLFASPPFLLQQSPSKIIRQDLDAGFHRNLAI
jgi:hypothetical protein